MSSRPGIVNLIPFAHVTNVTRPLKFYGRLCFEVHNTLYLPAKRNRPGAWMKSGQVQLILAKAREPGDGVTVGLPSSICYSLVRPIALIPLVITICIGAQYFLVLC
jgi:hypothetical protein